MTDDAQWKSINAERWDGMAARWREHGLPDPEEVRRVIAALGCAPGALLLDVGCGAGLWSVALCREGYRVHGIDASPQMIAEARRLAAEYDVDPHSLAFEVGDADRITLPPAGADGVICRNVLDFVPSPGAALVEIWRVLKPGRRMVLSVLGAHSPVKREAWRRFVPGSPIAMMLNHIVPWETEALVAELGWSILHHRPNVGPAASGATNEYTLEMVERLHDRVLQQAIATTWEFLLLKPENAGPPGGST
ncbi:MAG: hypothetical protein NVS2B16_32070 [Chloroflexota bacterium]